MQAAGQPDIVTVSLLQCSNAARFIQLVPSSSRRFRVCQLLRRFGFDLRDFPIGKMKLGSANISFDLPARCACSSAPFWVIVG